jgi:hypothetical protein
MKKLFLIVILLLSQLSIPLKAQIDSGDVFLPMYQCDFTLDCPTVVLYPTGSGQLWARGIPQKTLFNAAYSPLKAMVTDTAGMVPGGSHTWFDLLLAAPGGWENPLVSFYHRWDTDSLTAGCWIEISYDNRLNWKNILHDSSSISFNYPQINSLNLYGLNDTLNDGTPAFTGRSNGWVLTQFQWIWWLPVKSLWPAGDSIWLRFHYRSDSLTAAREGWMIDDLNLNNIQYYGGIGAYSAAQFSLYPNPANNMLTLSGEESPGLIEISDLTGRVWIKEVSGENEVRIDISSLPGGVYLLRVLGTDLPQCMTFTVIRP